MALTMTPFQRIPIHCFPTIGTQVSSTRPEHADAAAVASQMTIMLIISSYPAFLLRTQNRPYRAAADTQPITPSRWFPTTLPPPAESTTTPTKEQIIDELMILTSSDVSTFVKYLLGAVTLILEAVVPIAMAVVRYGVVSSKLEKSWNWVVFLLPAGLMAMPLVQTLSSFDAFAYVSFAYTLVPVYGKGLERIELFPEETEAGRGKSQK